MFMRKRGFIAIYTSNIEATKNHLVNIEGVDDIHLGLYDADILAEIIYDDCLECVNREIKNVPDVYETRSFW